MKKGLKDKRKNYQMRSSRPRKARAQDDAGRLDEILTRKSTAQDDGLKAPSPL